MKEREKKKKKEKKKRIIVKTCTLLLYRMKSLETDAVHAQAVIAKAQELSRGSSQHPSNSASPFSTVDIAFAGQSTSCQLSLSSQSIRHSVSVSDKVCRWSDSVHPFPVFFGDKFQCVCVCMCMLETEKREID